MPLAAVRAKDLAFLISISGAAIPRRDDHRPGAERNDAAGMKPETVAEIVAVMKLQYQFARTGQGWDDYAAARKLASAWATARHDSRHARPSLLAVIRRW